MSYEIDSKFMQITKGDHFVLLYNDPDEIVVSVGKYIRHSLLRNEKSVYVNGDADIDKITAYLRKYYNIDELIKSKQLIILNKDDVYSKSGVFDPDKMIDLIIDETKEAEKNDFSGLSITGEISWVLEYEDGFDKIIEYEWKLNERVFSKLPVTALCRYNLNKFTDQMIINVIQVHPLIIWKNEIHDNPYYVPYIGYKENDIYKYQLSKWLENINEYTKTKSKFDLEIKNKEEELQALKNSYSNSVTGAMTRLIELYDYYTKNHSTSVGEIAKKIAEKMRLDDKVTMEMYYSGILHDIGKVLVDRDIINKTGKLTDEEYEKIKRHSSYSYDILKNSTTLEQIAINALYHHERWDGRGYPHGIKEEEIPLGARILCIADAYDAMTSDRPYKEALTKEEAYYEIMRNSGKQFDPKIAKLFLEEVIIIS